MPLKQIDIAEVASNIVDLSKLSNDDTIKFLEQIRLFCKDAKKHGINGLQGCKSTILDGWLHQEDVAKIIKSNEEKAAQVISEFYDLVYEKYCNG
jgi:hypothetical protein